MAHTMRTLTWSRRDLRAVRPCSRSGSGQLASRKLHAAAGTGAKVDSATPPKPTPASAPAAQPPAFRNKQVFIVPEAAQDAFEAAWQARSAGMQQSSGFQGFTMDREGNEYTVESRWESIPQWEAYNLSKVARRSHLPSGIWQRVPPPGEGFPEDFIPFWDMNTFVNAKYPPSKKK